MYCTESLIEYQILYNICVKQNLVYSITMLDIFQHIGT
jgi:hypothetical protein